MFKKSIPTQKDLFRDLSVHLSERKSKLLNNPSGWHTIFYEQVFKRIDETVFSVLFEQNGRPNASLRVLLSMMILKEGNGWSDDQLFGNCRFDMRCMTALGLCHIDDDIPVESTYYEFRRRVSDYNEKHAIDLIELSFQSVTKQQINNYNIKGEKIRLDSKLINSNIAKSSRLHLILEALRVSINCTDVAIFSNEMDKEELDLLTALQQKTVSNITYSMTNADKKRWLTKLGFIIKQVLPYCATNSTLHRIYDEHYSEVSDSDKTNKTDQELPKTIQAKPPKDIPSESVQSIHDPEATYRSKGSGNHVQKISGYHANITETCSEDNDFNLITDVQLDTANVSESHFLNASIAQSNIVLGFCKENKQVVEHVTTDGGYDSNSNREAMALENMPHWNMAKHKGVKLRYTLSCDTHGNLQAYCKNTEADCEVHFSTKTNKYVITHTDKTKRYLSQKEVDNYLRIQNHLASQQPEDINIRPNVESTIHQVFHRLLKRNKMKYRGQYKCKMYCISRAYWSNFRRILKNEVEQTIYVLFEVFIWLKNTNKALRLRF